MQQYMLLIQDQDVWETLSGDEQHAIDEEYSAFIRELRDQGRFVSTRRGNHLGGEDPDGALRRRRGALTVVEARAK